MCENRESLEIQEFGTSVELLTYCVFSPSVVSPHHAYSWTSRTLLYWRIATCIQQPHINCALVQKKFSTKRYVLCGATVMIHPL